MQDDLKRWLLDLAKFMVENGYVSLPLPKVRFDDSVQNEDDPRTFKTGNYSESDDVITLYTAGRAIKDILRTFAHELIHVRQRQDGRLGKDVTTGNAIADDRGLREIEGEAFMKGSLALRDWTERVTHQKK